MKTSRVAQSKTVSRKPNQHLVKMFTAMAYDLRVTRHPLYIDALSLLKNYKYVGFLGKLDEMTSQMYTSMSDERFRLHQLAAFLSKYPFEDPSIDRKSVALAKFHKSEHRCRRMNQKFRARRQRKEPPHMQYMREYILNAIGEKPSYDSIFDNCDFGPGSTVGVHGEDTTFVKKLGVFTVTPSAAPVALAALFHNIHYCDIITNGRIACFSESEIIWKEYTKLDGTPLLQRCTLQEVQYNTITCVPKNAKTDRTIAIEPTLNGFLQKGVDIFLRRKLRRLGVDLRSQSLNQALARIGSRDGNYSTIDLSSASDSISIQLVKELLPPEWFSFLDAIRSPSYKLDDKTPVRYEKFCSMGNGFCFPLETLIFKAAVEYVMSVTHIQQGATSAVYGDDIIVPYECALLLIEVLRDLGFTPNTDKTFVLGGFKESCGADYFFGVNVRPVYLKKDLRLNYDTFPLLNDLRKRKLFETWQRVYDMIPVRWRYVRPYERDDDSAITVPLDMFMSSKRAIWNRDTQSWNWRKVVTITRYSRQPANDYEVLAGRLRGDLKHSEEFAFRFSESTRVQVGT